MPNNQGFFIEERICLFEREALDEQSAKENDTFSLRLYEMWGLWEIRFLGRYYMEVAPKKGMCLRFVGNFITSSNSEKASVD